MSDTDQHRQDEAARKLLQTPEARRAMDEREALVERMAEVIFNASGTARLQSWERYRAFYQERGVLSPDYYAQARAALNDAEPVVRGWERERIANLPVDPPPSADATDVLIAYRDAIDDLNRATDADIARARGGV